jgi:hypothetical protein
MRTIILACALLFATTAFASDVLVTRSMEMMLVAPASWVLTCNLEYTGLDATHTYLAGLDAGGGPAVGHYPGAGEVGPGHRTFVIDEPGVTRFTAKLMGHVLRIEKLLYYTFTGEIPAGTWFYCQGGVVDLTTGVRYPQTSWLMTDHFQ